MPRTPPQIHPFEEGGTSFVKLRRGILEHLPSKITLEEYAIYSLIILKADHRNGSWIGCALTLSKAVGKSERWCQRVLASLRRKGYIKGKPSNGRGQYSIHVVKYFEKASVVTPSEQEGVCGVALSQNKASVVTPYQEVSTYKNKREEAAQTSRGPFPAYVKRPNAKELEAIMEIRTESGHARKDYLEFIDLRDAGRIPKGMTWEKWREMSADDRKKALKAA